MKCDYSFQVSQEVWGILDKFNAVSPPAMKFSNEKSLFDFKCGLLEILQLNFFKFQTDKISIKMLSNKKYILIWKGLQIFLIP